MSKTVLLQGDDDCPQCPGIKLYPLLPRCDFCLSCDTVFVDMKPCSDWRVGRETGRPKLYHVSYKPLSRRLFVLYLYLNKRLVGTYYHSTPEALKAMQEQYTSSDWSFKTAEYVEVHK